MDAIESEEPRLNMLRALPLMHRLLRLILAGERDRFTKTQFYILITLHRRSPLTMTQIGELIGASKEQATRAVAPLADEGLVQREVSPQNRTKVYVSLTAEGRALVQELTARCGEKLDERMNEHLTAEEREALQMHLAEIASLLEKAVIR
ncbi:MAG: MarR family transcriptional regulator [Oscillospiraceae bacterium]|nr:MarR family transcriptional regulator [Oscillospiraceae bacterium]MBQ6402317.1 MarR family transcriptional regulator [Oscillospiraceae bacterium]